MEKERDEAQRKRRKVLFAPIATPSLASVVHGGIASAGGLGKESRPVDSVKDAHWRVMPFAGH